MEPAHNPEAERALLGAILVEPHRIASVAAEVNADDFFEPRHRAIFAAMVTLSERMVGIDTVNLAAQLQASGTLTAIGGRAYLIELANAVTGGAFAAHHTRIVRDASQLRAWASFAGEALQRLGSASAGTSESEATQEALATQALRIASRGASETEPLPAIVDRVTDDILRERDGAHIGIPTGLVDLDRSLCGLRGGDLVILAARPGMGKTSLVTGLLMHALSRDNAKHGVFCSLEMRRDAIVERMICERAGVSLHALRKFGATTEQRGLIQHAQAEISLLPLTIFDTPAQSPMSIRSMAQRTLAKKHDLGLIAVDYLQLMRIKGAKDRYQEVSEVSMSLKQIAREFNIPVIALSQLSRAVEQRPDKTPVLSDLRESGSIEQDADLVVFLFRPAYYDQDYADKTETHVILAKNRNGPTGRVKVNFNQELMRFTNREAETWTP